MYCKQYLLAVWPFLDCASVCMLDEVSVLFISFNAIDSVLFNMLSGVLATVIREREKESS